MCLLIFWLFDLLFSEKYVLRSPYSCIWPMPGIWSFQDLIKGQSTEKVLHICLGQTLHCSQFLMCSGGGNIVEDFLSLGTKVKDRFRSQKTPRYFLGSVLKSCCGSQGREFLDSLLFLIIGMMFLLWGRDHHSFQPLIIVHFKCTLNEFWHLYVYKLPVVLYIYKLPGVCMCVYLYNYQYNLDIGHFHYPQMFHCVTSQSIPIPPPLFGFFFFFFGHCRSIILNQGWFCSPEDIWQDLVTSLVVKIERDLFP